MKYYLHQSLPPLIMVSLQALWMFFVSHPLAILLCMVAYMLIGSVWYGPLFMKSWAKLTGVDKMRKEDMQQAMVPAMLISLATAFVQAMVLGRMLQMQSYGQWYHPMLLATVLWFAFTFMVLAQNYTYTNKSSKLIAIDGGYMLVSMWAMSLILWAMM